MEPGRNNARERAPDPPAPSRAPSPAPPPAVQQVLDLQRGAGNAAVARALAARSPAEAPGAMRPLQSPDQMMAEDVDFIAAKLKQQVLTAAGEREVLARIKRWADADATAAQHGREAAGAAQLDRFLLKLKLRTITRATARSGFMETTVGLFDTLFHELEDDRLEEFRALVASSEQHAGEAAGTPENSENFWATMGEQEAMGAYGTMKGLSQGLAGLGDAAVWAGRSGANLLPGVDIKDPGSMSKWVGKQLDVGGDMLFDNEFTQGEGLLGAANAGEIGTVGGTIIWNLVNLHYTAGAGASAAGGVAGGMATTAKVADYAGKLKGVDDALTSLQDYILAKREAGKLTGKELWEDAQFKVECMKVAGAIVGLVTGTIGDRGGSLKVIKECLEVFGKVFKGIEEWSKLNLLAQVLMDDSLKPAAKTRAVTTLVEELITDLFGLAGDAAAGADKKAADAKKAAAAEPEFDIDVIMENAEAEGYERVTTGFDHPEVDAATAAAAKEVLGKRISDFPALLGAWNEAKEAALGKRPFETLSDGDKVKLYDETRRRFWGIVQGEAALREIFTGGVDATPLPADGGFAFAGGPSTAPVLRGGENLPPAARKVWTVTLDHEAKKSTSPDLAVDPTNLWFVMAADNTMLNTVEARVLGSRRE